MWRTMYMPCGKYLVADREQWIASLESHGEPVLGKNGWAESVRREIFSMSASTIDRYLKHERACMRMLASVAPSREYFYATQSVLL